MPPAYPRSPLPAPTREMLQPRDLVTFFSVHEDAEKRRPEVRSGEVGADGRVHESAGRNVHAWRLPYVRLRTIHRGGVLVAKLPNVPVSVKPPPGLTPAQRATAPMYHPPTEPAPRVDPPEKEDPTERARRLLGLDEGLPPGVRIEDVRPRRRR